MNAIDKAREVRNKIAADAKVDKNQPSEPTGPEEMANALATITGNADLMKMYAESANIGSENIAGESLPLLKIHSAGKSLKNELANGEEPHNGYFFYKKTQQEYKEVMCHILTVSRGFRADGIEGKTNVFNQIVGGVIIDDVYKPFLMYFTGSKLNNLWEFGKEASKWTKAKPVGVPMFALTVKLTTEKVVDGAKNWFVVKFEISKDMSGNPELVTDKEDFQMLRDNVKTVEDMIDRLIANKATEDTAQISHSGNFDSAGRPIEDIVYDEPEGEKMPWDGQPH